MFQDVNYKGYHHIIIATLALHLLPMSRQLTRPTRQSIFVTWTPNASETWPNIVAAASFFDALSCPRGAFHQFSKNNAAPARQNRYVGAVSTALRRQSSCAQVYKITIIAQN